VEAPALLPQNRQALEAEAQKGLELPLDPNFGTGTGGRFRAGDDGQGTGVVVDLIGADPEAANGSFDVTLDSDRLSIVVRGVVEEITDRGHAGTAGDETQGQRCQPCQGMGKRSCAGHEYRSGSEVEPLRNPNLPPLRAVDQQT
jgi:hypothetical protein